MPDAFLLLRRVHLFTGLTDEQLREVAGKFHYREVGPDTNIFHQGDTSDAFFMIDYGTLAVVRYKGTQQQTVSKLYAGDYFGEMGLIHDRPRSASLQTETKAGLWQLAGDDFFDLLRRFPQIRPNLDVVIHTRQASRRKHFHWLEPEEVVYLIAGKHETLFIISLLPGVLGLLLALGAAYAGDIYFHQPLFLYLFIPVAIFAVGWMIWNYIDWDNDLYIVTNKRVVDYEKIVLIYDSRNEAPLATCRSVNIATDELGRIFGYGDVIVNTFSGTITFRHIANPPAAADLIQEQLNRQRTRSARADREALKGSLRRSMGLDPAVGEGKTGPIQPVQKAPPSLPNPLTQVAAHFSFNVRTESRGVVTYHKHPVVLAQILALPSLLLLAWFVVLGLRLGGQITLLAGPAFYVGWAVPLLGLVAWWLYLYEDWRNDIYQVTSDQILDINRKPLGQELRKTAPLNNILSIKTDRPGLLALLLNYGTVIIQTGPGGEMRFEGVYGPLGVQQDIFRRMEMRQQKAAAAEVAAERDRLSKVLGAFWEITLDEQRSRLSQRETALREEAALVDQELKDLTDQMEVISRAMDLAPYEQLDELALARLAESRERAAADFNVAKLRRQALETELQELEREIRRMEETAAAVVK
jgi:hypothetical protein